MHRNILEPQIGNEYKYKNWKKAHGRPDRLMNGRKYYTATQGISPNILQPHAMRTIKGRALIAKKWRGRPDVETDRQTYEIDWTPVWGINTSRR